MKPDFLIEDVRIEDCNLTEGCGAVTDDFVMKRLTLNRGGVRRAARRAA